MDKYEYNIKIDQLRQAVTKRDIDTAVKIADEIDWKKEKESLVLVLGADAYELNKQYDRAKELLLFAYEKSQTGKNLAYRLALISAKTKEFDEALEFYHDFVDMAPRDTARYVLQYRIAKAKGEPINFLIEILEEYVNIDMEEKWMYELAKLYHMAGETEKCVDLCDEMSLWFNHGDYVRRAMDLKKNYRPLTKRQQENYYKTEQDIAADHESEVMAKDTGNTKGDSEKELGQKDVEEADGKAATIPFTTLRVEQFHSDTSDATDIQNTPVFETQVENEGTESLQIEDKENEPIDNTIPIPGEIDIEDIHVKPFVGNGSDTIDIQAEIAKNIQEIMASDMSEEESDKEKKEESEDLTVTLDPLYKYDANGQIGLDIEVPEKKDRQITGQISIEEVLRNLEERGILKSDTVNKTVETMDQAAEAANKAAEEAVVRAELEKKNETIVQEIEIKDLAEESEMADVKLALESYADDAANGFVFTDEIDSEAIEKAMKDTEPMPLPEIKQEETKSDNEHKEVNADVQPGEKTLEDILLMAASGSDEEDESAPKSEEAIIELENDVPVLDLSFDVPVKKIHTGIAPASAPVAANTASLKELFADLDEATKREIGIIEDKTESKENVNVADIELDNVIIEEIDGINSNDSDKNVAGIANNSEPEVAAEPETRDKDVTETEAAEKPELSDETAAEPETVDKAVTETEAAEKPELSDKTVAESETVDKAVTETEVAEKPELSDETAAEPETVDKAVTETEAAEKPELSDKALAEAETIVLESEGQSAAEKPKNVFNVEGMPQVTTTINKNLTQPISLDIDKIVVSDEEMAPFESFKSVNGLEQKLKDTVIELVAGYEGLGHSRTGNIMILGDDKSGKTTMAIELIKLINKKRERTGRRIAKVDSSVLNTRGIRSSMKKLIGSDLIVENAHHLRKSVLQEFLAVGQYYTDNMLMIFEGETSALKTMRHENESIARMFDYVLVIKEYDVKEWVAYAKKYAATKNYMIDEMGTLALYKSIDDFYGKHQGIDQNDVESIVNSAIKKANGKIGRKFTNLFSGKNDDSGMDILKEVDFK